MLPPPTYLPPTELDQTIFTALIPDDHYLRRVKDGIDFERWRAPLASVYAPDHGRPAVEPLLLLKLEFLQYQYNLSDRRVLEQAQVNIAYRFFLDLSLNSSLPHHTLLAYFRGRLGPDRHRAILEAVLGQAREQGFVKDRLRLKDATHIIANIAVPSTLRLVADTRDQLLAALRPLAPQPVEAAHQRATAIRTATEDLEDEERLLHRVAHLREIVGWADTLRAGAAFAAAAAATQQAVHQALELAHKVLADRDERASADRKDQLVSVHDPDARRGKHGDYYVGYLLDASVDADSELITNVQVLPANGDEAADAAPLIAQEEAAHGNDVQALSMDAAGFRGDVLRDLTDPQRLRLEVIVPPQPAPTPTGFPAEQFVLEASGQRLTCPGGQTTGMRKRSRRDTGWQFHFGRATCAACPLQAQCIPQLPKSRGRTVTKNDYEAEYRAARAKVATPTYRTARREHRRIERKLGELVRWHGGRRARYRGRSRVLLQALLTAVVVNVKRLVGLLSGGAKAASGRVRAAAVLASG